MKNLKRQPKPPAGIKYALTVPLSVLFADLELHSNLRTFFRRAYDMDYEREYYAVDKGALSWNYEQDTEFNKMLIRKSTAEQGIVRFIDSMEKTNKNLDETSKLINSKSYNETDSSSLLKELELYWDACRLQMTSLAAFWNVENLLTDELIRLLKASGNDNEINDGLSKFFSPSKPNYFARERQELAKIVKQYELKTSKKLTNDAEKVLKAHADKYGFLLTPFNQGNPPTIESLIKIIDDLSDEKLNELANSKWQSPGNLSEFPDDIRQLGLLAQRLAFWKSERLDMLSLADWRVNRLYKRAAKSIDVSFPELFAMTAGEILDSLTVEKSVVPKAVLKERQKAFCLLLYRGKIDFYIPSSRSSNDSTGVEAGYELNGIIASKGKVTGKVRLIQSDEDLRLLKSGEILVTTMTRPEYGAALDRAAAFVTDEGGMLCHAAIISREMGKPCIIATGNATQLLKTGMEVTVDGDEGRITVDR